MIVKLEQEKTSLEFSYRFTQGNETICYAQSPFQMGKFDMDIRYADGMARQFHFDSSVGSSLKERLSFKLFENGMRIGTFVGATKRLFFKGYTYYELDYQGRTYALYAVGMGTKGLCLCLYEEDRLLAIAEKDMVVKNHHDTYTLYLESAANFPLLSAALLYYDVVSYDDFLELTMHSTKRTIVITRNKELLSKYDPDFIARIRAMDGTP